MLKIASFDIGKKNFAEYVDQIELQTLKTLRIRYSNLSKQNKRRVKGKMNSEVECIINKIYENSKRLHIGVFDLRKDKTSNKLDIQTRKNILCHLEKYENIWSQCDIIVIEQQYFRTFATGKRNKGTEANVDALKIGELVLGWFLGNYPFKEICYFGSQFKTQMLGAPSLQKKQRKEWAVKKAHKIFELQKDNEMLELYSLINTVKGRRMNEKNMNKFIQPFLECSKDIQLLARKIIGERQKMDDVADACLQSMAYKYRKFVAEF